MITDYKSITAAHFTTFPQTDQSREILARNRNRLQSIADNAQATIGNQARQKMRNSFLGVNVNTFA